MPFTIALLVFAVVTAAVFAAMSLFDQRKAQARVLHDRLSTVQEPAEQPAPDAALLRDEVLSRIPAFDTFLRRSDRVSQLQKMLAQGNVDVRAGNFLMLCAVSALLLATIAVIAGGQLLFGWAGALIGFFIPYAYASHMRTKRFQKFEETFPAATLLNLADRIPLVDVKFFVTAVMLQRETGGNLAEILDNLSYVIRERFKILRQVRVHTAQGRLTMVLLMSLPPTIVVAMLVLNPGFIRPLFTDPIGHALIVGGITLQTMGYFVIRKIIRIQV